MRKEIIIEKEDYKLKISVSLHDSGYANTGLLYRFDWIQILPKKKRKWQLLTEKWKYEYQYRNTPYEQKSDYVHKKYLEYLTEEDIIYIKKQMLNCICDELNPESNSNMIFLAR